MGATSSDPVSGLGDVGGAASAAPNKAVGKDQFLKLLIAQLEHQDPLAPKSDTEFVTQLATFSSLEQLVDANKNLQFLAAGQANLINSQALNLIGKEALVEGGDTVRINQGKPDTLVYALPKDARDATLTIYDKSGAPVRTFNLEKVAQGRLDLNWDGTDEQGVKLPDGQYTMKVSAHDLQGGDLSVALFRSIKIDAVNFTGEGIALISGNQEIPFSQILEIRAAH